MAFAVWSVKKKAVVQDGMPYLPILRYRQDGRSGIGMVQNAIDLIWSEV